MMVYDANGIPKSGPIGPIGPTGPTGPQGPAGGMADGDYGDITVSGAGTVLTIDPASVTFGKIQNLNGGVLLGRSATIGSPQEILLGTNLSMTGTTLNAAGISRANPSVTIGLTAKNGTANTFLSSDSAPALDVAIAPNWTGQHAYSQMVTLNGSLVNGVISGSALLSASVPALVYYETDQAVGDKGWVVGVNNKHYQIYSIDDAGGYKSIAVDILRGASGAFNSCTFGNTTDNPTYTFAGTGTTTFGGQVTVSRDSTGLHRIYLQNPNTGSGATTALQILNSTNTLWSGITSTTNTVGWFTGGPTIEHIFFGTSANIPISIGTNNTERIRITGAGAVQITSDNLQSNALYCRSDPTKTISFDGNFGTMRVTGKIGGYAGYQINDGTSFNFTFMSSGSGDGGIYLSSEAKWLIRRTGATTADCGYNLEAPSFNATSSRAIKTLTGIPTNVAAVLKKLKVVLYRLLADPEREQIGAVAEEVHEVCPWLSPDGKTVAYDRLALLLLADWQERYGVTS